MIIILILIITISLLAGIGSFYKTAFQKRIYNDALIVNQLGKIRGDIQRYVKLKIAHKEYKNVEKEIDVLFIKTSQNFSTNSIPLKCKKEFLKTFNELKNIYHKLKKSNKNLIPLSEKAWKESNKLIDIFEKIHKLKFNQLIKNLDIAIYFSMMFLTIIIYIVYKKVKKGLEVEVITDKLTNIYNRLYFNEMYKYLINRYKRNKIPFSMIIIDIDNFKQINDTYGHKMGDKILSNVANILKDSIRRNDLAFRYGGEEFLILLPDTKLKEAIKIAERIRKNIPQKIKLENKEVTISAGVGEYKGEESTEFFKKVDKALYEAKIKGKNKIIFI